MNYYPGIGGGGARARFVICDVFSKVQAQSIQPACHYLQCGLDGVTKVMQGGLYDCLNSSAIKVEQTVVAFIARAGYRDIEKDSSAIERAVKKPIHKHRIRQATVWKTHWQDPWLELQKSI